CGRPPGWTTRRWSTGSSRRRCAALRAFGDRWRFVVALATTKRQRSPVAGVHNDVEVVVPRLLPLGEAEPAHHRDRAQVLRDGDRDQPRQLEQAERAPNPRRRRLGRVTVT